MDVRLEDNYILMRALVKRLNSQAAVAKVLGVPKTTFRDWFNQINKIPFRQVFAMKEFLKSLEAGTPFTSAISLQRHVDKQLFAFENPADLFSNTFLISISQRVQLASEFEQKESKKRNFLLSKRKLSGKKIDVECSNWSSSKRLSAIAAKKFGLGSVGTYFRAKTVVQKGTSELIQAMDSEKISIYHAHLLVNLSPKVQLELLEKSTEERRIFLNARKTNESLFLETKESPQVCTLNECLCSEKEFNPIKNLNLPHLIPLKIFFKNLVASSPACGDLSIKPNLIPGVNLDFHHFLKLLHQDSELKKLLNKNETITL